MLHGELTVQEWGLQEAELSIKYFSLYCKLAMLVTVITHQHSNGSSGKEKGSFRKERR